MPTTQENLVIYADPGRCLGCHSCEMACAVAHGDGRSLVEAVTAKMPLHPRIHVVASGDVVMALQCRQCEDAPCTFACPTGACRQTDGQILINEKICFGCKQCAMVCPFGAITVRSEQAVPGDSITNRGVAKKCDLCIAWRAKTGHAQSACVEACPTKALALVDLKKYRQALMAARARELAQSHRHLRFPA